MKVLFGMIAPDAGSIVLRGQTARETTGRRTRWRAASR